MELCRQHGFAYYLAMANVITGWATAAEGDMAAGLAQLRAGLGGACATWAPRSVCPTIWHCWRKYWHAPGRWAKRWPVFPPALPSPSKNDEEWAVAELHRVQGDLLAAEGKPEAARDSFRQGVEAARQSGSLAFEQQTVASRRRNGRSRLHRTLLERPQQTFLRQK